MVFAEYQWNYIGFPSKDAQKHSVAEGNVSGGDNAYIGNDGYDGWIDFFGWGTGSQPTKHTKNSSNYSTFVDWGSNDKLRDALGDGWHTLNKDEWEYLIDNTKSSRKGKYGHATVNGVVGFILLPDAWKLPKGCTFTAGSGDGVKYSTNIYDAAAWAKMEANGAVFFACCRLP